MANNRVQIKRTSTSGRTPNTTGSYATNSQYISAGELALNMADGILYSSDGSAVIPIGANNANVRITNGLILDNDKRIYFRTLNAAANAMFVQQVDDNFVFYSTNTAYQPRPVWSIYANSDSSNLSILTPTVFNSNIYVATVIANGSPGTASQVLTSNGSTTYWSSPGVASVNTSAQYTWTNTHTFQANVSFTGNNISLVTNTGSIFFAGSSDSNWRIGRNTGGTTKFFYTGNTLDVIAANSSLEGIVFGYTGNSYLETGYAGTFTRNPIYVGNASVNTTINSSSFYVGTTLIANATGPYGKTEGSLNVNSATQATNATNLNSQPGSYYTNATNITTGTLSYAQIPANIVNTTGSFTLSGNTTLAGTNTVVSSNATISGFLSATGGSKISVMENQDGGNSRGIFLWNDNDTNWGIYMSQSGANKSLANGTATAGLNGSTTYAVRFRVANASPTDQAGFIWENYLENALMQLEPTNGDLFVRRNVNAASYNVGTTFVANTTQTLINSNTTVGNSTFANTFLNSSTGISNPQSLTAGVLQTNASLNTLIVGPYTISTGNSLIVTTGSRLVII